MTIQINRRQFMFYVWVGFAYMFLWILVDAGTNPGTIVPRIFNNIWRAVYIILINFIFFEYTLPFIRRRRKYLIYNILLGFLLVWLQLMLCSFGLYAWRAIGIGLHVHTSLKDFKTTHEAVSYGTPAGIFSI